MKLIAANWKMHPDTIEQARRLASQVEHGIIAVDRSKVEIAICPPAVFMPAVRHAVHFVKVGSQNIAPDEAAPHTGELRASHLLQFDTKYVIVGHSERRNLGEDEALINKKILYALEHGLEPILCVGFGLNSKSSFMSIKTTVKKQLEAALKKVKVKTKLTIAYEPSGAISRGLGHSKYIDPKKACEAITYIKSLVPSATVIYGASIDSRNARELAECPEIEGGLVGGSSLDALEFLKIIKEFTKP